MTYVITQRCCNDASCVAVCPVDCIRPTPGQPEFVSTEMLYIDPQTCISCGACVDVCPVGAIFAEDELSAPLVRFKEINAAYFERHPLEPDLTPPSEPARPDKELGKLRVAIIGAGPAGCYTAAELLARADTEVEMLDKLPTPWGLIRSGVAPDHAATKTVSGMFESAFKRDAFQYRLNVEVGKHISLDELRRHHHAVVYAVGASADKGLGIPGESLPGSHSATEFVAWYNGHPAFADRIFDLSGERAVIVGNGNVALDIARILTMSPDALAGTDIADHALEALRHSNIREVVLLGRRGPAQAAYSTAEFLALGYLPDVDVVIEDQDLILDPISTALTSDTEADPSLQLKIQLATEYAQRPADPDRKRIVFRYLVSPFAVTGDRHVETVEIVHNELIDDSGSLIARPTDRTGTINASLLLRSVGYRGQPLTDLPFDDVRGIIPNEAGRVVEADSKPMTGVYVTGWIKRGARGMIGSNRGDAAETVDQIIADFQAGKLDPPVGDRATLANLLAERQPDMIDRAGWRSIDQAEKARGEQAGRPRAKFTDVADMVAVARRAG
jgi:ferredoxin--NADP+ reductase